MENRLAGWLMEWFRDKGIHRTLNYGKTLGCPIKSVTVEIASPRLILFCPLCGKKLGKMKPEKETENYIWEK